MNNIIIIGASGHAKVIIDIIEKQSKFKIIGLIDSFKKKGFRVYNYEVLGTEDDLPDILKTKNIHGGIIAIGDNCTRLTLHKKIVKKNPEFKFINAIHPTAVIGKDVTINSGSVVMAGAVINSNASIGGHCIVNTKSSVGHDTVLKNFSSVAPGVTLGGGVTIKKCSAVSIGATVIECITIGSHTVIGAGSLVNRDIGDYKLAYGTPAKVIRDREENHKYLGKIKNHKKYTLTFNTIDNEDEKDKYLEILRKMNYSNTFYSLEYCSHQSKAPLHYFVLYKNGVETIIMPIYLNKIETKNYDKTYFDACSPYGYSGPLFSEANHKDLKSFWKRVDKWYKKNNVVTEFIRFNLENNHDGYSGHLIPTLSNIKGEIIDFNELWGNFKQKVRNNYRKAEKHNLKCVIYNDINTSVIDKFYTIYIKTMQRNAAAETYFYPKSYFENLTENNNDNIVVAVVYKDAVPISVELIIVNDNILYSYLGGTLAEYFSVRPNDFLKIEVMKWAIANNKQYYVLGGGRKDNDGLYQYKKSFFPKDEDVEFYTGRKIINDKIYKEILEVTTNTATDDVENLIEDSNTFFPLYKDSKNVV